MKLFNWKSWVAGAALAALALVPTQALAVPVGLELLLLVDVSGSVSDAEYALQKDGYVAAFKDTDIHSNIATITGGVAVGYAEWSRDSYQALRFGWSLLTDAASSNAFAAGIDGLNRLQRGLTAPGTAIDWGQDQIENNIYDGKRLVIDISGDGKANDGANTKDAATAAKNAGITVNGLAILGETGLEGWYKDNITDPGGGFLVTANGFSDFEDAVKTKIGRETVVPEPSTVILFGTGLAGLAAWRMRKGKKA